MFDDSSEEDYEIEVPNKVPHHTQLSARKFAGDATTFTAKKRKKKKAEGNIFFRVFGYVFRILEVQYFRIFNLICKTRRGKVYNF